MMRKLLISLCVCVAVTLGSSSVAVAGLDEAVAAYKRGDYAIALKEFRALASEGDAIAQNNLGVMYEKGQGVTQDDVQALMWFNIGAKNGREKAKKGRDFVEKRMTASDISRARKLAKEWMAKHQK